MESSPPCKLSIIIVNFNTADMLERCLASIASDSDIKPEVIVVDNASQDNTYQIVKDSFPSVRFVENKQNLGFARANNQVLRICKGEYIHILGPDTEVRQGTLKAMIQFMESHPEVGLAGTRIINPDGSPQPSLEKRYPGEKYAKKELKGLKGSIAWVLGASMIARTSILVGLGGFDEGFFVYGEEQDLCLRVRKAGLTIGFIPDAVVVHWGGQSERNTLPVEVWKKKFEAELTFYKKHYSARAIRSIRRANLIHALWRVFTLRLTLPFCTDKESSLNKLNKYRLALKAFSLKNM